MTLSTQDGRLFFKLFLPLLDYTNRRYPFLPPLFLLKEDLVDQVAAALTAQELWKRTSVISDYLAWNRRIPQKHRAILQSWRCRVSGQFLVLSHGEDGSIFVSLDDFRVYLVLGIQSPLGEILPEEGLPVGVTATLLPFKKSIITDGLIIKSEEPIEEDLRKGMEEVYEQAQRSGSIVTRL